MNRIYLYANGGIAKSKKLAPVDAKYIDFELIGKFESVKAIRINTNEFLCEYINYAYPSEPMYRVTFNNIIIENPRVDMLAYEIYKKLLNKPQIKKAQVQELAEYLGVTSSAVSQYDPKKKELMLIGLAVKQKKV